MSSHLSFNEAQALEDEQHAEAYASEFCLDHKAHTPRESPVRELVRENPNETWLTRRLDVLHILMVQYNEKVLEAWDEWRKAKDAGDLDRQDECIRHLNEVERIKKGWEKEMSELYERKRKEFKFYRKDRK